MAYAVVVCKRCKTFVRLGKERYYGRQYLCDACYTLVSENGKEETIKKAIKIADANRAADVRRTRPAGIAEGPRKNKTTIPIDMNRLV